MRTGAGEVAAVVSRTLLCRYVTAIRTQHAPGAGLSSARSARAPTSSIKLQAELHVLPPLCPLSVSPGDFSHARELIDRAKAATGGWLDAGRDLPRRSAKAPRSTKKACSTPI